MSYDVGEVTERLENELCFSYVTTHSPTLPLLHLHHSSFSNPSFASFTSQNLHLIHLASIPGIYRIPTLVVHVEGQTCLRADYFKYIHTYIHTYKLIQIIANITLYTSRMKTVSTTVEQEVASAPITIGTRLKSNTHTSRSIL